MFIDILCWIRGAKCKFEIKGLTYSKFVKCLGIRLEFDEDFVDCSDDLFWSQNYRVQYILYWNFRPILGNYMVDIYTPVSHMLKGLFKQNNYKLVSTVILFES